MGLAVVDRNAALSGTTLVRRERITIGHKSLSYLIAESPEPANPRRPRGAVVLLHAFPLQAAMWAPTLEVIPENWRAIAPDFRGFGDTPLPPGTTHLMADLAGDVVDLLDHLHVPQAVIVGCSMGGYVAFQLMRSAPRYVTALGLVSTRAGADSEEGRQNRRRMMAEVDAEGVGAVAAQMAPKLLGLTTQKQRPDLIDHVRGLILPNSPAGVKAALQAMMERDDSTPVLAHIEVPTLVVHGAEDTLIPIAEAESMYRSIPRSDFEAMTGSGHLPNLEQPDAFNARLGHFLGTL